MKREAIVSNHQLVLVLAMFTFGLDSTCQWITCSSTIGATGHCRVGTSAFRERVALYVVMSLVRMSLGSSICELSGRNKSCPPRPWMTPGSTSSVRCREPRTKTKFVQPGAVP